MEIWKAQAWLWLVPALLALIVNLNVLQNGFVWDDNYIHLTGADSPLGPSLSQGYERVYSRPVVSVSLKIDHWLWGRNPSGFHLTNLMIHVGATLLITVLASRLFRSHVRKNEIALLAGSLFAVYPVHAEAVAWVAGRNDLLPGFFLLASMLIHDSLRNGARGGWALPAWAACSALALLSKESAFPLLLMFPLYDLLVWKSDRAVWRRLGTLSSLMVIFLMIAYLSFRSVKLGSPSGDVVLRGTMMAETIQTVLLTLGTYIKHLVIPYPSNAFMLLPETVAFPQVGLMVLGVLSVGLAVWMTVRSKTRPLSIGLWAVLLGLSAPAIVPLVRVTHAPLAERYLYLPTIGLVFLIAVFLSEGRAWLKENEESFPLSSITIGLMVILISGLSAASFYRNQVWRDDRALWEDTVTKSPGAAVPHNLLGLAYRHQGRYEEAKREFQLAIQATGYPHTHALAANNLGGIYYQERLFALAQEAFERAIDYESSLYLPYYNLGVLNWERFKAALRSSNGPSDEGNDFLTKAHQQLVRAVIMNPSYADSYYVLGLVDLALQRNRKARENFEKVVELDPSSDFGREAAQRLAHWPVQP